jgi:hypothetical protein
VNRRRRNAKILLHGGFGRRPAMQARAPGFAFTQPLRNPRLLLDLIEAEREAYKPFWRA